MEPGIGAAPVIDELRTQQKALGLASTKGNNDALFRSAGRARPAAATPRNRAIGDRRFPEYDKPGRFIPEDPAADEEFLRRCRERAEQQRRAAKHKRAQDGADDHDAGWLGRHAASVRPDVARPQLSAAQRPAHRLLAAA